MLEKRIEKIRGKIEKKTVFLQTFKTIFSNYAYMLK